MGEIMPANPPTFYPCLFYQDAKAAIAWLARAFGFDVLLEVPGPEDSIAHAEMSYGNGVIMLGTAKAAEGWKSPRDLPGVNQVVYVAIEDPDTHCRRAREAGAEITLEPRDTDYGSREYNAKAPEGHRWCFGTYRPAPK
jgi:uncharacterized glyoxalase superfamily protein PhnB